MGKAGFSKLSTCLPQQPIKTLQNNGGFATENLVWNHIKWLHADINLPKFCDRAK